MLGLGSQHEGVTIFDYTLRPNSLRLGSIVIYTLSKTTYLLEVSVNVLTNFLGSRRKRSRYFLLSVCFRPYARNIFPRFLVRLFQGPGGVAFTFQGFLRLKKISGFQAFFTFRKQFAAYIHIYTFFNKLSIKINI